MLDGWRTLRGLCLNHDQLQHSHLSMREVRTVAAIGVVAQLNATKRLMGSVSIQPSQHARKGRTVATYGAVAHGLQQNLDGLSFNAANQHARK
eukprot:9626781-Karenia_brevis.AAC.1